MALLAVDDDRAAGWHIVCPLPDIARNPAQRSDQHPISGVEVSAAAHVDDDRRRGTAAPVVE